MKNIIKSIVSTKKEKNTQKLPMPSNVKFTPEKGDAPYVHGGTELSVRSLSLSTVPGMETRFINLSEMEFELLSDEEIEAELLSGGKQNEEHH